MVIKDNLNNVYLVKNIITNNKNIYYKCINLSSKHNNSIETIKNPEIDSYKIYKSDFLKLKCKLFHYLKSKNKLPDTIPNISDLIG